MFPLIYVTYWGRHEHEKTIRAVGGRKGEESGERMKK